MHSSTIKIRIQWIRLLVLTVRHETCVNVCHWHCGHRHRQWSCHCSQKLQASLLAIQSWLNIWRMKANETKSVHVTFTTRRETCPPAHINEVQFPQENHVRYLGLHLDRRLTWHTHILAKHKQLWLSLTKIYWLLGRKNKLSTNNKLLVYKAILKPIWTYGI
jgi:hypothetical protein